MDGSLTGQRLDFGAEPDPDSIAARERLARQKASLATSAGWLLAIIEWHAALVPPDGASPALRLRQAARTLAWTSPQQERLAEFSERYATLDAEAEQALARPSTSTATLTSIAVRLEQASSEALAFYVSIQSDSQQAQELSRTTAEEEEQPTRLTARAEIGAAVRARLASAAAEKVRTDGLELYRVRHFLSPAECEAVVELIERDLFPSAVLGDDDGTFRTSKSCNLQPADPPVATFEERVAALVGMNPRFAETVQGQRYEVGQQFKPHVDYFSRTTSYYADVAARGGQRTWTAMLYLNVPEDGGATDFPKAGACIKPEAGMLLIWNNMRPDGRCNGQAMHHGTPVLAGRKYVLTKWFRERAYIY